MAISFNLDLDDNQRTKYLLSSHYEQIAVDAPASIIYGSASVLQCQACPRFVLLNDINQGEKRG